MVFKAYCYALVQQGKLVYVNYGRVEDFEQIAALGVPVENRIVIFRYGKIFHGDKVQLAQERNTSALIIFSDPADYSSDTEEACPSSWWMPPTGVKRGTIFPDDGDPLTPGFPSISKFLLTF